VTNAAYDALWPQGSAARGAGEALQVWREACQPGTEWERAAAQLREALLPMQGVSGPPRHAWSAPISLHDGRAIRLRLTPLPSGATLVSFRPNDDPQTSAENPDRATGKATQSASLPTMAAPTPRRVN
jgi:hypothetical protein